MSQGKLDDRFREQRLLGETRDNHRGITKERIAAVLDHIGIYTDDIRDAVFALLDDTMPSCFANLEDTYSFSHGATTAHIGAHVGILQRGGGRLDREGRDYWIKPLRSVGAAEPVTLVEGKFVPGHVKAKSPYSAYRLTTDFLALLESKDDQIAERLAAWASTDSVRDRLAVQATAAQAAKSKSSNRHEALIQAVIDHYGPRFLPDYRCIYTDAYDGDRVDADERAQLKSAGLELTLADSFPDVVFYNQAAKSVWCVEAVISDGEVDLQKLDNLKSWCARGGLRLAGATTAYRVWKDAAGRQAAHKNLAPGTYLWIQETAGVHYLVNDAPARD